MPTPRKPLPPVEYLRECFDAVDGILYWRERPPSHFLSDAYRRKFLRETAGKPVPQTKSGRYAVMTIRRVLYYQHRVIWKIAHGSDPEYVDHKNGNGRDNRIENLREATQSQNFYNAKRQHNNRSGYKGVIKSRGTCRWMAHIGDKGRCRDLGSFATREEAADAYFAEAQRVAGEFARRG
jgi:hypothetical protein